MCDGKNGFYGHFTVTILSRLKNKVLRTRKKPSVTVCDRISVLYPLFFKKG